MSRWIQRFDPVSPLIVTSMLCCILKTIIEVQQTQKYKPCPVFQLLLFLLPVNYKSRFKTVKAVTKRWVTSRNWVFFTVIEVLLNSTMIFEMQNSNTLPDNKYFFITVVNINFFAAQFLVQKLLFLAA